MAVLQTGDIYLAQFYCYNSSKGQLAVNSTGYFVANTTGVGCTQQAFADQLATTVASLYKSIMSATAQFWGVRVARTLIATTPLSSFSAVGRGPGLQLGPLLPTQTAGLLRKGTAYGGKRYRGRWYLPFPATDHNTAGGDPTAAYVVAAETLATFLRNDVLVVEAGNSNTLYAVLLHKSLTDVTKIISATVANRWATMRKRGAFGATNLPPAA
jgi:hypothetical protein